MLEKFFSDAIILTIVIAAISMVIIYKAGKNNVLAGLIGIIMVVLMISFLWYAIVV